MKDVIHNIKSPLFAGIEPGDLNTMLGCIGYHISTYEKGEIVAFEGENMKHIGIVISGTVDMIKEDLWGNRTMLMRERKNDLFGETFACGSDNLSVVTFLVSEDAQILFRPGFMPGSMPRRRLMNTGSGIPKPPVSLTDAM